MALLVDSPSMTKVANIRLPKDPQQWNQEILRYLFESYDWIDVDHYGVTWSANYDGPKGSGTGVVVLEKERKKVSIPVIVNNFEMEPLDVMYVHEDKSMHPLTQKTMEQAFNNTDITDKLVERDAKSTSLYNSIFPPHWGRYVFASVAPERLCEHIEMMREDREWVKGQIKEATDLLIRRKNMIEFLAKVASRETVESDEIPELTSVSGVTLSGDDERGYRLGYLVDGAYHEKRAGYAGVRDFLQDAFSYTKAQADDLVKVADAGRTVSVQTMHDVEKVAAVSKRDIDATKAELIDDESHIVTRTEGGQTIQGYVIPTTYSFDAKRMTPQKLIVDRERNILASSDQIAGVRKGRASLHSIFASTKIQHIRPGMTIAFAWRNTSGIGAGGRGGQSTYLATQPVRVLSVGEVDDTGPSYNVMTPFGAQKRIVVMRGSQRPVFNDNNRQNAVFLPENTIVLFGSGSASDVVRTPDEFKASITKRASAVYVARGGSTGELMLKTAERTVVASEAEILSRLTGEEGLDVEVASRVVKQARVLGSSQAYRDADPGRMAKFASWDVQSRALDAFVEELRSWAREQDLVKVAVQSEDVDTLDKVLSLNFINRRNLVVFFKTLPKFKETVGRLANLLVASRIGKIGVDSEVVADAMSALQTLVEKMEGFRIDRIEG